MTSADLGKMLENIKEQVNKVLSKQKDNILIIREEKELADYVSAAINNNIIAIDTETNNSLDPTTCKMMGLCLYTPGEKQAYVPLNHRDYVSKHKLPFQLSIEEVKVALQRIKDSGIQIIMHNGKFDFQVIKCTCGLDIIPNWDTMLAARVLNENEKASLKWQYKNKIDPNQDEYKIEKLFNKLPYADIDIESFALYSATDAYITYELYKDQYAKLSKKENEKLLKLFKEIEMPMVQIAGEMELIGIKADLGYVQRLKNKYLKKLAEKEVKLQEIFKDFKELIEDWKKTAQAQRSDLIEPTNADFKKADFNKKFDITNDIKGIKNKLGKKKLEQIGAELTITSPKQLSIFFYDILEATNLKGKKPRGTGKKELKMLIEHFKDAQDILEKLKNYNLETEDEEELKTIKDLKKELRKRVSVKPTVNNLDNLIDRYKKATTFCELLLDQRQYNKLITTYLNSIPKLSKHWPDGKIRFHLNSFGAATGRFSSGGKWIFLNEQDEKVSLNGMNQQNLPSRNHEIRLSFIADEGRALVSGDFGSQEPKITAFVAQDYEMLKAFREKKDIYAIIAQSAFGNKYEDNLEWYPEGTVLKDENGNEYICKNKERINEKGKERRKVGKTIFLAITYGMGANSLADLIRGKSESKEAALSRAEEMLEKVFEKFKGAKKAIDDSIKMCRKYGYVEGLLGRRRRLPDLNLPHYSATVVNRNNLTGNENRYAKQYLERVNETGKDFLTLEELENLNEEALNNNIRIISNEGFIKRAERQCFNAIIQGSAATMTKRTMIMIYNDKFLRQLDAHLVFQIHDELLVECPLENVEKVEKRLQYLMEHSVDDLSIDIPMACDMVREFRWGEDVMSEEIRGEYSLLVNNKEENPINAIYEEYPNFPKEAIDKVISGESQKIIFEPTEEIPEETEEIKKSSETAEISDEIKKAKKKQKASKKAPKTTKKPNRDISFNAIIKDLLRAPNEPITIELNEESHIFKIEGTQLVITSIRSNNKSTYKLKLNLDEEGNIKTDSDDKNETHLIKIVLGLVRVPTKEEIEEAALSRRVTLSIKKAIKNKEIEVVEEGDDE